MRCGGNVVPKSIPSIPALTHLVTAMYSIAGYFGMSLGPLKLRCTTSRGIVIPCAFVADMPKHTVSANPFRFTLLLSLCGSHLGVSGVTRSILYETVGPAYCSSHLTISVSGISVSFVDLKMIATTVPVRPLVRPAFVHSFFRLMTRVPMPTVTLGGIFPNSWCGFLA